MIGPDGEDHPSEEEREAAELDRLLVAAERDPAERPAFTDALIDGYVYLLASMPSPVEGYELEEDDQRTGARLMPMDIVAILAGDESFVPVFTSIDAIRVTLAERPGTPPEYVRLPFRMVPAIAPGYHLVLNPDGPHQRIFPAVELDGLLAGVDTRVSYDQVEAGTYVAPLAGVGYDDGIDGDPDGSEIEGELPDELLATLARFFVLRPSVLAGTLGWIAPPGKMPGYLLVVRTDAGEQAIRGIGEMRLEEIIDNKLLYILTVTTDADDAPLASVAPFYIRRPQPD